VTLEEILAVYEGSSGDATKALYALLEAFAPRGVVAMNLFRTCKASARAKVYRGGQRGRGSYRSMAYEKKDWSIAELARAMVQNPDVIESWGWGFDHKSVGYEHVLYVDVPGCGQVSFHTATRRDGFDYAGEWDGATGTAPYRIARWIEAILAGREAEPEERNHEPTRRQGTAASATARGETEGEGEQKAFDL
jgi:hypothetical protein